MLAIKHRKVVLIILAFCLFYVIRLFQSLPAEELATDKLIGREIKFSGVIVSEPDIRDNYARLTIESHNLGGEKVMVTVSRFPKFEYGDYIEVRGEIDFPKKFENDLGREFDYPSYLAKDGIRYVSFAKSATLLESGRGSAILTKLYAVKNKFVGSIELALPEPYSSLALGVTIGLKHSLGSELLDTFRSVGIIHIVVLSGFNMTIILDGVLFGLSRFTGIRRGLMLLAAALLTFVFALLVGLSATVLRASLMALLAILARFFGRPVFALRALFFAAAAMLLWNPLALFYDPSFQLSFLATFGLITLSPILERKLTVLSYINRSSAKWKQIIKEIFIATVATQIFVLPAIVYMTGDFSPLSLLVNLIILPLVPSAMLFTGMSGLIGLGSLSLSKIAAVPAFIIFEFIIKISRFFENIPLPAAITPSLPLYIVGLCYAGLLLIIWREKPQFTAVK